MVDIIFHYPFLGAMGDHSKSKSIAGMNGICPYCNERCDGDSTSGLFALIL